jgi:DNA replication factor GINS
LDYTVFYEAWHREKESSELQRLDKGFYAELSEHIKAHGEELHMLDDKTLRAKLAIEENNRIEKLLKDLLWTRCRKIFEAAFEGKRLAADLLTIEEEIIYRDLLSTLEKTRTIEKETLKGHIPKVEETKNVAKPKKTLLIRFLQDIPSIVGMNTKVYGPFKAEDVAALPTENVESLIKRGIAVKVEIE